MERSRDSPSASTNQNRIARKIDNGRDLRGRRDQIPVAGIALIVLGILLLLHTLDLLNFDYVVRYWPVLLIAAGAYLLYGRFTGNEAATGPGAPNAPGAEERCQILTLEILHDDVRRAIFQDADIEDAGDVLALQANRRAGLALKALDDILILQRVGMNELQRDHLVEMQVPRRDDDPHPAGSEGALDAVLLGEHIAGTDGGRNSHTRIIHRRPVGERGAEHTGGVHRCHGRTSRRETINGLNAGAAGKCCHKCATPGGVPGVAFPRGPSRRRAAG